MGEERIPLRAARMIRGLTQQEMANKLNVHVNTYAAWEKKPEGISIDKAYEISNILKFPIDSLIFFEN